jgi:phage-related minor tail protein
MASSREIKGITIEIAGNSSKLVKSLGEAQKAAAAAQNNLKQVNQALKLDPGNVDALVKKQELLNRAIEATKQRLEAEKTAAASAKEALELGNITQTQYDTLTTQILKSEASLNNLERQAQETTNALNGVGQVDVVPEGADEGIQNLHDKTELLSNGLETVVKVGDAAGDALAKGFDVAASAASTAVSAVEKIAEISTKTVENVGKVSYDISREVLGAYGSYQQLVGGVEKIFGDASDTVIRNAEEAYLSATLSANDYMETVVGFSASLVQGLGGDTQAAAQIADMALRDMSDNANTFGTDLQTIMAAYQSLARGNFGMLDSLRLGYGGTKTELIRLINDSETLEQRISSLDGISFDQIINAIHAVQDEMGITGTTSREAATTVEGSFNMVRASWQNLLVDLARSDSDAQAATEAFANSLVIATNNVKPILRRLSNNMPRVLPTILSNVRQDIPDAVKVAGEVMNAVGQSAVDAAPDVLDTLIENLPEASSIVTQLLTNLSSALKSNNPAILEAANTVLPALTGLGADIISIIIASIVENAPEAADALMNAIGPILDEAFGEGTADRVREVLQRLVAEGPEIVTDVLEPAVEILGALLENADEIADVAVPLISFAADHLPEIIGLLVGLKTSGTIASIGIDILGVVTAVNALGGTSATIGGTSTAFSGLGTAAAGAGTVITGTVLPAIAALAAGIVSINVSWNHFIENAEGAEETMIAVGQTGMDTTEVLIGGFLELADSCTTWSTNFAGAYYDMQRAQDEADLDGQAQEIFANIEESIESSGASATASVADDVAIIQGYLNDLQANGNIELHARVVTEYQTIMTEAARETARNVTNAVQSEMASRYALQGRRQNTQERIDNSVSTAGAREYAEMQRRQGEAAIQAVQKTAETAQNAIAGYGGGSGSGGGGGGGGSSKKSDDEETVKASSVKDLIANIDANITKVLEKFGIITQQTEYQKNVNQQIDGVLEALKNNYSDENIEAAMSNLANTMQAFGMDGSVVDATTLEQLRTLVNQPVQNQEAFAQVQGSVQAIQAATVDYTPHFENLESITTQIAELMRNKREEINFVLGSDVLYTAIIDAMNRYNYETGGN